MKYLSVFVLLIIVVSGGWFYLKPKAPQAQVSQAALANTQVISVSGNQYRFSPDTITVKKGQAIRIALTSVDMPHNFAVDEFNVKGVIVSPGQTGNTDFTATKTGTFEFYCSVGNHRQKGMVGKLIVE